MLKLKEVVETEYFRFFKNGNDKEIYLDISFSIFDNYIYLKIKTPIEVIIYSTIYKFYFYNKEFFNFFFTNSKCQQIGDEWISNSIISNNLFYIISHYETEKIEFGLMLNYPDSYFSLTDNDKTIFLQKCKELFEYAAGKSIISRFEQKNKIPSVIDDIENKYNYKSRYGRRMSNRLANYKYEYGSKEYRNKINLYGYLFAIIVFIIFIIKTLLKSN